MWADFAFSIPMNCGWCRLSLALIFHKALSSQHIHHSMGSPMRCRHASHFLTSHASVTFFIFVTVIFLAGCAYFESNDVKRGDQHLAAGKWEEASMAYRQALKEAPFDQSLQEKYSLAKERAASQYQERGRAFSRSIKSTWPWNNSREPSPSSHRIPNTKRDLLKRCV